MLILASRKTKTMRKQFVLIPFVAVAISLVLCSYHSGPALSHGWDCTGAETGLQNPAGCSSGGGCHASAATAAITIDIELDSAGIPVTKFVAGKSYTVKITGTNTGSTSLPGFGYQISCISGATAQVTPTNAGTWGTPPATSQFAAPQSGNFVLNIIEQSNTTAPTTGTGTTGTTYQKIIPWTAPATGMDTVSFWVALNAVNGDTRADAGDLWNVNHAMYIVEDTAVVHPNGIATVSVNNGFTVYPNPVNEVLNLQFDNAQSDNYTISVYNVNGQMVASEKVNLNTASAATSINTSAWEPGVYIVSLQAGSTQQLVKVVKQ